MARARTKTRSARRTVAKRTTARTSSMPKPARRTHAFTVSHLRDQDFKGGGLRDYVEYRDLGISKATSGMAVAHVLRFCKPCDPAVVSQRHYHDVDFQMIYVLKGWIKSEFEGHGAHVMNAGDSWIQPPRIRHAVLDYSNDCELLEIVLPADFKTVALE